MKYYNIQISALDTPIGKISIHEPFKKQFVLFQKYIEVAHILSTSNLRIFSFLFKNGDDKSNYFNEVISRLDHFAEYAKAHNITILLENDIYSFCDNTITCKNVFENINNDNIKLLFDPGNFLRNKVLPYSEAYKSLKNYIGYFHIKDMGSINTNYLPLGKGDCDIFSLLTAILKYHKNMFFSLEPHLYFGSDNIKKLKFFNIAFDSLEKLFQKINV